ncbi:hypothetical protein [Escherichia phage FL33]|uniref:Uncharacterized protein n=1 Tax=Escherichia phage FL33 TaxID=3128059 RepID=A0AAX4R783_9CAUD
MIREPSGSLFFISKIFHKTVYKHKALWYYTTIN